MSSDDIMLRRFPVLSGWDHCNASFVFVGDCLKLTQTWVIMTFTFNSVSFNPAWLYQLWQSYNSTSTVIIQSYPIMTNEVNTTGLKWHHAWTANKKKNLILHTFWKDNNVNMHSILQFHKFWYSGMAYSTSHGSARCIFNPFSHCLAWQALWSFAKLAVFMLELQILCLQESNPKVASSPTERQFTYTVIILKNEAFYCHYLQESKRS